MQLSEILPIVERIVKRRCSSRIKQDAAGLATLRVFEAISDGFEPDNPIGFVSVVTHRAITDTIRFELDPRRDINADLETLEDHRIDDRVDLDDLLSGISNDELDKRILDMRAAGLTFREIAEQLEISKTSVTRRLNVIQDNYANLSRIR